ncbi:MAG: hypothetical protein MUO21_05120 [Nitrososphaeraceae archaeon]|nr:hypothetical protein [Nitrososphaeraceae archaeon]
MPLLSNNKSIFILIISMLTIIIMESVKKQKVKWIRCIDSEKLEKRSMNFYCEIHQLLEKVLHQVVYIE